MGMITPKGRTCIEGVSEHSAAENIGTKERGWRRILGEMRNEYKILVRKLETKRPLRRSTCRLEGNIDFKEIQWEVWTGFSGCLSWTQ
jgi:hypothetical protein